MEKSRSTFHPITRFCAGLGATICAFFAFIALLSGVMALPDFITSASSIFMGMLCGYLAWCFWFARKHNRWPAGIPWQ